MDELRHARDEHEPSREAPPEPTPAPTPPDDAWGQAVAERLSTYGTAAADTQADTQADAPEAEDAMSVNAPSEAASAAVVETVDAPSRRPGLRGLSVRRSGASGGGKAEAKPKPKTKTKTERKGKPKKLVGLKIGASQIAAARVVNNGAAHVVQAAREPIPPGLVVAGEVRDAEALADELKSFFARHKLPKTGIRLGLSNNRIGVRVFELEAVDDERQLENAIRFRAEEVLPIPLDEAVLDYVVLGEQEREDGTLVQRILLVVAYRDSVERYLAACRMAGLQVVGVDLEAFALLRSLAPPTDPRPNGAAIIAVAVGYDRTTIAVSDGRVCEFTRVLEWGGLSLNVAIARELDRAPSEVEGIKLQLSFAEDTTPDGLTPEQAARVREGVRRALSTFARELVASLHFYQAQPGALAIGEVVLTGGTAHMPGLPEELSRLVGVPVRLGDPFKRVVVDDGVQFEGESGSLAVAVGLGIED